MKSGKMSQSCKRLPNKHISKNYNNDEYNTIKRNNDIPIYNKLLHKLSTKRNSKSLKRNNSNSKNNTIYMKHDIHNNSIFGSKMLPIKNSHIINKQNSQINNNFPMTIKARTNKTELIQNDVSFSVKNRRKSNYSNI